MTAMRDILTEIGVPDAWPPDIGVTRYRPALLGSARNSYSLACSLVASVTEMPTVAVKLPAVINGPFQSGRNSSAADGTSL